jgi:hypothetical protein
MTFVKIGGSDKNPVVAAKTLEESWFPNLDRFNGRLTSAQI